MEEREALRLLPQSSIGSKLGNQLFSPVGVGTAGAPVAPTYAQKMSSWKKTSLGSVSSIRTSYSRVPSTTANSEEWLWW